MAGKVLFSYSFPEIERIMSLFSQEDSTPQEEDATPTLPEPLFVRLNRRQQERQQMRADGIYSSRTWRRPSSR